VNIGDLFSCWEWIGYKKKDKYGQFYFDSKAQQSNRVAWILTYGEIPKGLFVCHKCDNPSCCNPSHLFLGTNRDNIIDMYKKGRNTVKHDNQINAKKLSHDNIVKIKSMKDHRKKIAVRFGVTQGTIYKIQHNRPL
jgi:hypothetical protein